ncbi:hypothetical protein AAG570_010058 [Ranatra chinensis]|uniref:Uncharacterized protein n=1 Tax=Ranatra chinensis TaxID=642074 RepID=A0ABD0YLN7_9HEMI
MTFEVTSPRPVEFRQAAPCRVPPGLQLNRNKRQLEVEARLRYLNILDKLLCVPKCEEAKCLRGNKNKHEYRKILSWDSFYPTGPEDTVFITRYLPEGGKTLRSMSSNDAAMQEVKTLLRRLRQLKHAYPPDDELDYGQISSFMLFLPAFVTNNTSVIIVISVLYNEDLRYSSYKRRKGQLLTEKARERRLMNAKKLLSKVKHPAEPQTISFFSDEKNFCQDQKHNTQNNRWLAYSTKDIPRVMQTKFPQTVMVFGCVSSKGDVMPPHLFQGGLRLTSDGYVELLNTVVKPWIRRVANALPRETVASACSRFQSRIEAVIDANGGYFEPDANNADNPDREILHDGVSSSSTVSKLRTKNKEVGGCEEETKMREMLEIKGTLQGLTEKVASLRNSFRLKNNESFRRNDAPYSLGRNVRFSRQPSSFSSSSLVCYESSPVAGSQPEGIVAESTLTIKDRIAFLVNNSRGRFFGNPYSGIKK